MTPWQVLRRTFFADRAAVAGLVLIALVCLFAFLAPVIASLTGHGPNQLFPRSLTSEFGLPTGPSRNFLFGVDQVGRDLFVRVAYGLRTSLVVGLLSATVATAIGVTAGTMAGYFGGWADVLISRLIEIFLSLPILLFAVSLSSVCSVSARGCVAGTMQPGMGLVIAILVLFTWPYIGRIVRGEVLRLRQRDFVEAAECLGARPARVIVRDLLPNLIAPILVYLTLAIPSNILFEAALSFLGVGIPQTTPSLGGILSGAVGGDLFTYAWWLMAFPGVLLVLATVSFNLVGDGLRDALDVQGTR